MGRRPSVGEGSVYFDAQKDRWVGAMIADGRRYKVVAKTKTEARKRLDGMRHANAEGRKPADGNVTVAEVLTRWKGRSLASRDLSTKTLVSYEWCISRLIDELGSKRVRTLTVDAVEAALDRMVAGSDNHRSVGRSSLIKIRSVLGQALNYAVKRGLATNNVCRLADLTPNARRAPPKRSLTAAEAKRGLVSIEGDRLEAMFVVMLAIGLRPGEAAGLTWDGVDIDAGRIAVRHGVRVEDNRAVLVDELKTARSRRTIDLPLFAAESPRLHRAAQLKERSAARSWDDDRLVFTTTVGTVLDPRNVARILTKLTEAAGLGHWSPNELRHSAASLLSAAGVPLELMRSSMPRSARTRCRRLRCRGCWLIGSSRGWCCSLTEGSPGSPCGKGLQRLGLTCCGERRTT